MSSSLTFCQGMMHELALFAGAGGGILGGGILGWRTICAVEWEPYLCRDSLEVVDMKTEPIAWRYFTQGRWVYVDKNPNLWLEKPDGQIQPLYAQQTTDCLSDEKNAAILTVNTGSMSN